MKLPGLIGGVSGNSEFQISKALARGNSFIGSLFEAAVSQK
jgi:hypothetical protein